MKATQQLHDAGQSLWLDNITRDLLTSGTLKRYIDEWSVTRPHLESDDLRPGDQEQRRLRRRDPRSSSRPASRARRCSSSSRSRTSPQAADLFRPVHERTAGVDGWVSLEVSPLLAYDTKHHARRGQGTARARGTAQSLHQDPRHQGGAARDRRGDLRRRADQRDAALLARALRRGGGGLSARHRAAHRRRAQPGRGLGRIALHQPLGRGGRGQGARCARQPARHRHRQAHLQGLSATSSPRRAISA